MITLPPMVSVLNTVVYTCGIVFKIKRAFFKFSKFYAQGMEPHHREVFEAKMTAILYSEEDNLH